MAIPVTLERPGLQHRGCSALGRRARLHRRGQQPGGAVHSAFSAVRRHHDWRGDPGLSNPRVSRPRFPNVKPDISARPTPLSSARLRPDRLSLNVPRDLDLGLRPWTHQGRADHLHAAWGLQPASATSTTPYLTTTTACVQADTRDSRRPPGKTRRPRSRTNATTTPRVGSTEGHERRRASRRRLCPGSQRALPYDPRLTVFQNPLHALETLATATPSRYDISINVPRTRTTGRQRLPPAIH